MNTDGKNKKNMGKILIIVGAILLLSGILLTFFPVLFKWFGKLPGDIYIKKENFVFFAPITSMLLLSLLFSLFLGILNRFLK